MDNICKKILKIKITIINQVFMCNFKWINRMKNKFYKFSKTNNSNYRMTMSIRINKLVLKWMKVVLKTLI